MGQLEDFRASLKKRDSAMSSEGDAKGYYEEYPEAKEVGEKFCE